MPFALMLVAIDAMLIVHAAKTGRLCPWAYVILAIPGIGALAYIVMEIVPEWMRSIPGQQVRARVAKSLNPDKRYRELSGQLAIADTIANRVALADECLALGRFEEARQHFDTVLGRPMGDEPAYALGKARAQFGLGLPLDAAATLDWLRETWPHYQSAEGHLLYARALEQGGLLIEALTEYEALSQYYPGAEARVRYGLLLRRMGREGDAKSVFGEVLTQLSRAPKYVRRVQADWIATAQKALRA
jgi:hypothetical protein